jgi:signal transduction histidine kinase
LQRELGAAVPDSTAAHLSAVIDANKEMDVFLRRLAEYCQAGSALDRDVRVSAAFAVQNAIQAAGLESLDPPVRLDAGALDGELVPAPLQKVLVELLDNARKFRSTADPSIGIRALRSGGDLLFDVSDNGIGVEPEARERIFEPLERLHSQAAFPGFGFGLAISRRILSGCDGRIWAQSNPGGGSIFSVAVPAF